jgi:hypothetical protein
MSAPAAAAPPSERLLYHVPPLGLRIIVSGLILVPMVVLLVGLPVAALAFLQDNSIALPVPFTTVAIFGFAIAILMALRYIAKPTRLYGPVSIATSAAGLLYLLVLYFQATYHFDVPNATASIAITYARLVELLMVVPAITMVAGVVTTVEDLRSPRERLPFDFPA